MSERLRPCLKCRFYYYSGMVRTADQKTAATEKIILLTVPRQRGWDTPSLGVHRKAPGARGTCGELRRESPLWFPRDGRVGSVSRLRTGEHE